MKNIYVFYGKPKTGKSNFMYNAIYDENKDLITDVSALKRNFNLCFMQKYKMALKHYRNVIIDDFFRDSKELKMSVAEIWDNRGNFDNLILITQDKNLTVELVNRVKDFFKDYGEEIFVNYLNFNENE